MIAGVILRLTALAAKPPAYPNPLQQPRQPALSAAPSNSDAAKLAPSKSYAPSTSRFSTSEVRLINGVARFCAVVTRHKVLLISAPLKRVTASFSG